MAASRRGRPQSQAHREALSISLKKARALRKLPLEELRRRASKRRRAKTLSKYGLTEALYQEMFLRQSGLCAICGTASGVLDVDHCHTTGKVRDLLCRQCNLVVGNSRETVSILLAAAKYVQRHKTV